MDSIEIRLFAIGRVIAGPDPQCGQLSSAFLVPRWLRWGLAPVAAIAMGAILLLGASSPAKASAELFALHCARCHNDIVMPHRLVYNAAGNALIIAMGNAQGMQPV